MKKTVLISAILLTACHQADKKTVDDLPQIHNYKTDKDTVRHAIITYNAKRDSDILGLNVKAATLSTQEITQIERIIKEQAALYNKTHSIKPIIEPEKYYKKIIPTINVKGEKIVWVDCFCQVIGDDWKTTSQIVSDGGSCYLHLKINLTTGKISYFSINGIA